MDSSGYQKQNKQTKNNTLLYSQNNSTDYYSSNFQNDNQKSNFSSFNTNNQSKNAYPNYNNIPNQFNPNQQMQYNQQNQGFIPYQQGQSPPGYQQSPSNPQFYSYNPNQPNQQQKQKIQIPEHSIVRKYSLSFVNNIINKHIEETPEQFKKQWRSLQYFNDVTTSFIIGPLAFSWAYVLASAKKKWFKLTADFRSIRFNVIYLTGSLFISQILYTSGCRAMIAKNLMVVEGLIQKDNLDNKSSYIN